MSSLRRSFFVAVAVAVVFLAARLLLMRPAPSGTASATLPALAQAEPATSGPTLRPTETTAVSPTPVNSPTATSTDLPPSVTPIPPSPTPSASPSPTDTLTPLAGFPSPGTAEPSTDTVVTATETAMTAAAPTVTYTLTISNVFGRREPVLDSDLYRPLARGQSYTVAAQSADGIWMRLDLPESPQPVWVPAAFGVTYGNRETVPLDSPARVPVSTPGLPAETVTPAPPNLPYLPAFGARARDIYRYGLLMGNNPHAFIKIGDCQAKYPFFLAAFDSPKSYRLGNSYAYLQEAIGQFAGSFKRDSVAAQTGFGTATELDPQWANPNLCRAGESPLECEYRTMVPSLAIISLGTNDIWVPDGRHEKNMRQIIDYLIRRGVVPILSTKADNVEGDGSFNRLMVQLAAEYQLPLWDFYQVTRSLPKNGLVDTYHLSGLTGRLAVFDDPQNMQLGWPWRNLTALQALDAVWRAVR